MTLALPRHARIILITIAALAAVLLILCATLPISWFKGTAERALARRFDAPVRIGALERESLFSLTPVIDAVGIHVAQPAWAGTGDLASIQSLRLRINLWSLFIGKLDAEILSARGLRLDLVRTAEGRANWRSGTKDSDVQSDGRDLAVAQVDDAVVRYRDARQQREFTLAFAIDPRTGLTGKGRGKVDGAPVTLALRGTPLVDGKPWPFDAVIDGPALGVHAKGSMEGPLRTDRMQLHMTARADDLKRLDRIIEAGLFGTRAVNLTADVRHEDNSWFVENLAGTIGISQLNGRVTARKVDGRTKLDGVARFKRLQFNDLASDAGNAKADALKREIGPRIVPNTRINIRKIDKTDGRIAIRIDQVVADGLPSRAVSGIRAVLNLDNRLLRVEDIRIDLRQGAIIGTMVVDQRADQPKPRVTMALDMVDSRISTLAGSGAQEVDGRLDARVRLTGTGDTIREAVGQSDGMIGLAARSGALPSRIAAMMGFDLGRGLFGGTDGQTALRCAALRLDLRGGRGAIAPLVIDTGISKSQGSGSVTFPDERLDITLTGAPKGDVTLRLPGKVMIAGSIRDPHIIVPKETKSIGNVLKAIGRAISGDDGQRAIDADCAALRLRAIGR